MRVIKITRSMLKDAETLLTKVGAINGINAYPYHVYMNKKDYIKLTKNVRAAFKKEYPYLVERKVQSSVAMYMLNLGPNELGLGIKEGYLLVDDKAIEQEKLSEKKDANK